MKPTSLRPCRNAAALNSYSLDEVGLRNPTTGIAACCARAAWFRPTSAPPATARNCRRFICPPFLALWLDYTISPAAGYRSQSQKGLKLRLFARFSDIQGCRVGAPALTVSHEI